MSETRGYNYKVKQKITKPQTQTMIAIQTTAERRTDFKSEGSDMIVGFNHGRSWLVKRQWSADYRVGRESVRERWSERELLVRAICWIEVLLVVTGWLLVKRDSRIPCKRTASLYNTFWPKRQIQRVTVTACQRTNNNCVNIDLCELHLLRVNLKL